LARRSTMRHSEFVSGQGTVYRQKGFVEIPFLSSRGEPLALELDHFLTCVTDRTPPKIGISEATQALRIALEIRALAGTSVCSPAMTPPPRQHLLPNEDSVTLVANRRGPNDVAVTENRES
jgi:hypothetical protein